MTQTDNKLLEAILGEHTANFNTACLLLESIPIEAIDDARQRIDRLASFDPFVDPAAWQDGTLFKRAHHWLRLLKVVRPLLVELQKLKASER